MDITDMVDFFAADPNMNVMVADEKGLHKVTTKQSDDPELKDRVDGWMTCRGCKKDFPRILDGNVIHEPDADICLTCLIDEKIKERGYGWTKEDEQAIREME